MNSAVVIQARRSSSRLRDKIFLELPGNKKKSVLATVIERSAKAGYPVIVATTVNPEDDLTEKEALKYEAEVFRGSLEDVLSRYMGAAEKFALDNIVRITSDCPCADAKLIETAMETLIKGGYDYVSNVEERVFPFGLDTEAFTTAALSKAAAEEKRPEIREHVTYHIRLSDSFKKFRLTDTSGLPRRPDIRATLDTGEDYTALCALFSLLPEGFSLKDILEAYEKYPWLTEINGRVYHKKPFVSETEELEEAVKLLKLHRMDKAAEILGGHSGK